MPVSDASEMQFSLHFVCTYPGSKTPAEPEDYSSKTHTIKQPLRLSVLSSRKSTRPTRRLTTTEASAHNSAFYTLIILQYVMQYLVLLISLCLPSVKIAGCRKVSILCIDFKPSCFLVLNC